MGQEQSCFKHVPGHINEDAASKVPSIRPMPPQTGDFQPDWLEQFLPIPSRQESAENDSRCPHSSSSSGREDQPQQVKKPQVRKVRSSRSPSKRAGKSKSPARSPHRKSKSPLKSAANTSKSPLRSSSRSSKSPRARNNPPQKVLAKSPPPRVTPEGVAPMKAATTCPTSPRKPSSKSPSTRRREGDSRKKLVTIKMDEKHSSPQKNRSVAFTTNCPMMQGLQYANCAEKKIDSQLKPPSRKDKAKVFLAEATDEAEKGNHRIAIEKYTLSLKCCATEPMAWAGRGRSRLSVGEISEAFTDLNEALRSDGRLLGALRDRADIKIKLQDPTGAIRDCDRFLKLAPCDPRALCTRARAKERLGDVDSAEIDLKLALRLGDIEAKLLLQLLGNEVAFPERDLWDSMHKKLASEVKVTTELRQCKQLTR